MISFPRAAASSVALALAACPSLLLPGTAAAQARTQAFNVKAQPLAEALVAFGKQADVQILFPYDRVAGLRSQPLAGRLTRSDALRQLIAGTPLRVVSESETTILLTVDGPEAVADRQEAQDIVVTGQRAQLARGLEIKRQAKGIVDAVASNEMGRLPDRNVAEVIERLPGVGVQYDQGEGRYVAVRGVPADLNGYTLNGFEIGNPDGDTRALPLDIISGQLLNRVEVTKVKTADQPGQGIGGTINLVTQTAFDYDENFVVSGNAQVGAAEISNDTPYQGDLSIGGRFGADEQFGLLLGASYQDRPFTSYGLYPDDWFPVAQAARGGMPTNIKYSDYHLDRERISASGSFDWRPDADNQLYVRGFYSAFRENEYRQRFRLDFADADAVAEGSVVFNPDGLTGISTDTEQRSDLRLEKKDKYVLVGMVGGEHRFDRWTLDWGVARIHNILNEPNQSWQFRGNPGDVAFDFTDKLYSAVPVNGYLEPGGLQFRSYSAQDDHGEEDSWDARLDLRRDLDFGSDSYIRFGANVRTTDKSFDGNTANYGRGDAANRFSLDGLAGDNLYVDPGASHEYYIAPTIDADAIKAFTRDNLGSARMVLDETDTLADAVLGDYNLSEDVYAGYVSTNLDFGSVALTAGLRVERTELSNHGYNFENEEDVVPVSGSSNYTNWLPSVIARIKPRNDVVVRLAYSRSIGRPQYDSLRPGGEVEYVTNDDGTVDGSVSLGNPQLRPYVADALDMVGEWYFSPGGILSVGVFAKFIKDPVFTQSYTRTDTSFGGRDYDRLDFSQPLNADKGDIVGLEASYQQQLTFLPGLLSGLGAAANVTLIDSTLRVPDRDNSSFPQQSNLLWGAELFYQRGIVEASVAYHQTGAAIDSLGSKAIEDIYNDDLRRLDAKLSIAINRNFSVYGEAKNLTDEPTRQYQNDITNWVTQNERYGRTYAVGASVRF